MMIKIALNSFLIWIGCFFLFGCISNPPNLEYTLARSALAAANEAEAPKYASGYWHKAQSSYKKAVSHYEKKQRDEAQKLFILTRQYAERAENSARLKRAKGDTL